jgi:hypothetical protein
MWVRLRKVAGSVNSFSNRWSHSRRAAGYGRCRREFFRRMFPALLCTNPAGSGKSDGGKSLANETDFGETFFFWNVGVPR